MNILVDYIINLYKDVPNYLYEVLALLFCLGTVLILAFCGIKKGLRYMLVLLLIEYLCLLYCSTLFFRPVNEDLGFSFQPFWSYTAIQDRGYDLLGDNIMNLVVFVPIGLLLGCIFKNIKWWHTLLMGCGISLSIETLQFILHRGFSEFDDFMHNTLGCLIGYGIYFLFRIE